MYILRIFDQTVADWKKESLMHPYRSTLHSQLLFIVPSSFCGNNSEYLEHSEALKQTRVTKATGVQVMEKNQH